MKADFFIDRPVFSTVLSIIIVIVGAIGLALLPVDQYPQIVPPVVRVSASYPGADAQTVTQAVATPIEQELNGTPGMIYMESSSSNSGGFSATVTFDISTDPDLAAVDIQNRLKKAEARMPQAVITQGIQVEQTSAGFLLIYALSYKEGAGQADTTALGDYAARNINNELRRVPGVGKLQFFSSEAAMRVWVDPDKLTKYALTVGDVITALKSYNVEASAGQLGGAPATPGQRLNAAIVVQHLLQTPEQFANIPLRASADGSIVRIKDIGRVIRMLVERGLDGQRMGVVLVEQYYDFAAELADQYLVMERGEVIARGPGSEMKAKNIRSLVAI